MSWLSPLVLHLVESLQHDQQPVVYYFAHPTNYMERRMPAHKMLSSVISQLLALKPQLLRVPERVERLKVAFENDQWKGDDLVTISPVLRELFAELSMTYVILDRVDRCSCKGNVERLVNHLLEASNQEGCRIKILMLVAPNDDSGRVMVDVPENAVKEGRYVTIDKWHQPTHSFRGKRR